MLHRTGMARWAWGVCCVCMVVALFGCSGDDGEDGATAGGNPRSDSQSRPNVAPTALQEKGFRFSSTDAQALGAAFHIQGLSTDQPVVTLAFGDFNGTLSAPFTLVAGGSRASGTATRGDSYTL